MRNYLQDTQRILADQLGLDESEITPEKDLYQDLHADSLDNVELIMAFEEEYDIEIDDADAEKCRKVADLVAYLEERFRPSNDEHVHHYQRGRVPITGLGL